MKVTLKKFEDLNMLDNEKKMEIFANFIIASFHECGKSMSHQAIYGVCCHCGHDTREDHKRFNNQRLNITIGELEKCLIK